MCVIGNMDEIEVTPEIVEAGIIAAREHCLEELADLGSQVFVAMPTESRLTNASASPTSSRK